MLTTTKSFRIETQRAVQSVTKVPWHRRSSIASQTQRRPRGTLSSWPRAVHQHNCCFPVLSTFAARFSSRREHNQVETLRQLTRRVLETEGPLTPKAWAGAETSFDMWTCHPASQEGVDWGWKLLDRLVQDERQRILQQQEQQNSSPQQQQQEQQPRHRLTPGWLHRMVGVYVENELLSVDAEQVLAKIKAYDPILTADETTLRMILRMEKRSAEDDRDDGAVGKVTAAAASATDQEEQVSTVDAAVPKQTPVESITEVDWEEAERTLSEQSSSSEAYKMLDRLIREDSSRQRVSTEWLNRIVQAWCDKQLVEPTELLVKLSNYAPLPDASTYGVIVSSIKRTSFLDQPVGSMSQVDWNDAVSRLMSLTTEGATQESVSSAWKVLDRLVEEERHEKNLSSDYKSRLDPQWVTRIVEAWSRLSSRYLSAEEPSAMLVRITSYAPHLLPDRHAYQVIVDAVAKASEPSKGEDTSSPRTMTFRSDLDTNPTLTTETYNAKIMELIPRSGKVQFPEAVEAMLEEMWELYHSGIVSVKPNTATYNIVLKALVRSGHSHVGEKAEAYLQRMQELSNDGDDTVRPDSVTIITVMSAWASTRQPVAVSKVEGLSDLMKRLYQAGDSSMKPNKYGFLALLNAISKSNRPDAGDRAEATIRQMQELYDSGINDVKPTTAMYNILMKAWMLSKGGNRLERAERVEATLNLLQQKYEKGDTTLMPSFVSYNTVISAWSRCKGVTGAGDRAERVLRRMEALAEAGDVRFKPSQYSYNGVIIAHARSGDDRGAEKAEMVLNRLLDDPSVSPNGTSFNIPIAAYARRGSVHRAESLLRRMQGLGSCSHAVPNAITYAKMALAWQNSKHRNAMEKVIEYLKRIQKEFKTPEGAQEFKSAYDSAMRHFLLENDDHGYNEQTIEELKERLKTVRMENGAVKDENDKHPKSTEATRDNINVVDEEDVIVSN